MSWLKVRVLERSTSDGVNPTILIQFGSLPVLNETRYIYNNPVHVYNHVIIPSVLSTVAVDCIDLVVWVSSSNK